MFQNLEKLQTWKFWVLIVVIFLPIWGATTSFCVIAFKAKAISVSMPDITFTAIADQLKGLTETSRLQAQMSNAQILVTKQALLNNIDETLKLDTKLFTTKLPTDLEGSRNKTILMQLKDNVSAIKLIPIDSFDQINNSLESLKKSHFKY